MKTANRLLMALFTVLLVVSSGCETELPVTQDTTAAGDMIGTTSHTTPAAVATTVTSTEAISTYGQVVGIPPPGQIYHAVFPGGTTGNEDDITPAGLKSYEDTVGKPAAWVFFSHNWYAGRDFPVGTAAWIRDAGSVPYIRLMLWSEPSWNLEQMQADPVFSLQRIIDGEFDEDLRAWARSARDFGSPIIAEYGVEVNGEWFPWNGVWNGGGETGGYGDPFEADGPERFRDAYRRIIDVCRQEGADNVIWVFHVNYMDWPEEPWNRLEEYYPGDEWVDWLGVSVYGALTPLENEWYEFEELMDDVYTRVATLSAEKLIIISEFGVTSGNPLGDQADWAEGALEGLTALRWPRVIGFCWWNEHWENDDDPANDTNMRVQDNPELADVFRRLVGQNEDVLGRVLISG